MSWLNYHHLLYFWTVAREGSVSAAARRLRLAQPTVSGQLKALEESLGVELFHRQSGRLSLTDTGAHVYRYADEIFTLGQSLRDSLAGFADVRVPKLVVGIAEVVPKLIALRMLEPALRMKDLRVVCYEDRQDRLLAELAVHALDLVLTDAPATQSSTYVRAYSHLLGECGVTLFAQRQLADKLRKDFPRSLDGAPLLLPTDNTSLRRNFDEWLQAQRVRPIVRAEVQDSALLKAFGQAGVGVFPAPSAIESEVANQYGVRVVGRIEAIRERFYAVTVERRLKHPAVLEISRAASSLFEASPA